MHRVLKGQVQRRLHVGSPLRTALLGSATVAEQAAEQITQVAHVIHPEATAGRTTTETTGHGAVLAHLVVFLALLGVAQHVIGRADLLEALFGSRVGVRVILLGQLPVGARDLFVGRRRHDAEHLVVVLLEPLSLGGHVLGQPRTLTMAGRTT